MRTWSSPVRQSGVVLAVLQFTFALTWVVYSAFLPTLAAQVGIARSAVPWILAGDQAIFLGCDWLAGVFADRVGDAVARLGRVIAGVALVSCAAFVSLPLVAPAGSAAVLATLVVVWSATSSMLRAPTLALVGRHASRPARSQFAGGYTLGLAAAGTAAPVVVDALTSVDPWIPFAATSAAVGAMALVLAALPHPTQVATPEAGAAGDGAPGSIAGLVAPIGLLALGVQVHTSLTSAPIYLRVADPEAVTGLLSVFWFGCAIAAMPAAPLVRRWGGSAVVAGAGTVGAAAMVVCALAGSLTTVVIAHGVAGLAWGAALSGTFAAAGSHPQRPGTAIGLVSSMLAAATVTRIGLGASGVAVDGAALLSVPPMMWAAGAVVAAVAATRTARPAPAEPPGR